MNKKKKTININNPAIELIQHMQQLDQETHSTKDSLPNTSLAAQAEKQNLLDDQKPLSSNKETRNDHTRRAIQGREAKSKRLNILVRPSLHQALLRLADEQMTSVNELINVGMKKYIDEYYSQNPS